MSCSGDACLSAEDRARVRKIDAQLAQSGWLVQGADRVNVANGRGVAVREFILRKPQGPDYILLSTARR